MNSKTKHLAPAPPSRNANPFATCWTKPGALTFRFPAGQSPSRLVDRLAALAWRGEIIGPHGSGKSTLLEALKPAIAAAGCEIHSMAVRDGQHRLPNGLTARIWSGSPASPKQRIFIIDGYEQLQWWERLGIQFRARRQGIGLLVTSHRPTGLSTLINLAPDQQLVQQLARDLCTKVSTGITPADVAASYARHGGNVREVLFDLYDQHERWRRHERTSGLAGAYQL